MPELPEVETIKNDLLPHLKGRKFTGVIIHDTRPLQGITTDEFCHRLIGRKVLGVKRRGKYIMIKLDGEEYLIIHLRMTGSLLWDPVGDVPFARMEFFMDNGGRLVFTDTRRFGIIHLTHHPEKIVGRLGIEPLSDDFTPTLLHKLLQGHTVPIKSALLRQELIAGIGNMYADEALFAARIHPQRPANSLTEAEIKRLHRAIITVLKQGIRNKGASIRNYRTPDGEPGHAHEEFAVAHHAGEQCPCCGSKIERIVVSQRGTFFCPHCQR